MTTALVVTVAVLGALAASLLLGIGVGKCLRGPQPRTPRRKR
ncbi:hypothetical protein [Streptacidiphilus sp. PAMC 29251]